MSTTGPNGQPEQLVDWTALGRRLAEAQIHYVHHAEDKPTGDAYYAAVMRRALGGRKLERLHYETVDGSTGLVTKAEADWLRESHTIMDRLNLEAAERKITELRAEITRLRMDARADVAQLIRDRCNDRTVPSRYRREGALWAADLVDPDVPKDRYGRTVQHAEGDAA